MFVGFYGLLDGFVESYEAIELGELIRCSVLSALPLPFSPSGSGRQTPALDASRLVGTCVFSFFGNSKQTREWLEKGLEGKPVKGGRAKIAHQDGSTTRVGFNILTQRDDQGETSGATLILRPQEEEALA